MIYRQLSLFILFIAASFGQIRLETSVTPDSVTVGDRVQLKIQAVLPEGQVANFPNLESESEAMTVIGKELAGNSAVYLLTFWEVGAAVIPEIEIQIFDNGKLITSLSTKPFNITIYSVLDESATDIRDIKGMQDVKLDRGWLYYLYISLILLSAAAAYLFWRRRSREIRKAEKWVAPPDPPHVHAVKQLEALTRPYPITVETAELYYLELSRIFREFIEHDFYVKALEMTTSEFNDYLGSLNLEGDLLQRTHHLISMSDLSKFARHVPDETQFDNDKKEVISLVNSYHALVNNLER
ncbi:MAG: hypothetical protein H8D46_02120 [FCB group bacterium]|nr:hypothetical protein [FCB group bacterium]